MLMVIVLKMYKGRDFKELLILVGWDGVFIYVIYFLCVVLFCMWWLGDMECRFWRYDFD